MGKRGPKPTPTAILKLRGAANISRRDGEITPPNGTPVCPVWASEDEQIVWVELVEMLSRTRGLLTENDSNSIWLMCEAICEMNQARKEIASEGSTCYSEKGGAYQHPAVGRKNSAIERLRRLMCEFGMTPASRTSVTAAVPVAQENEKKKFFA